MIESFAKFTGGKASGGLNSLLGDASLDGGEDFSSLGETDSTAEDSSFASLLQNKKGLAAVPDKSEKLAIQTKAESQNGKAFNILTALTTSSPVASEGSKTAKLLSEIDEFKEEQGEIKQNTMNAFLTQMQNQFGIKPAQILQAFSKLDAAALEAPPEDAKEGFLNNLNLKGEKRAQAGLLYDEMTRLTGQAQMAEQGADEIADEAETLSLQRAVHGLSKLDQALNKLNSAIAFEKANAKFDPAASDLSRQDRVQTLEQYLRSQKSDASPLFAQTPNAAVAAALIAKLQASANGAQSALSQTRAPLAAQGESSEDFEVESDDTDGVVPQGSATGNKEMMLAGAFEASVNSAGAAATGGQSPSSQDANSHGNRNSKSQVNSVKQNSTLKQPSLAGKPQTFTSPVSQSNPSTGSGEANLSQQAINEGEKAPVAVGASSGAGLAHTLHREESDANIQQIIHQAQVIAKKGGGEMKLELRPEGIGHVNLKVSVNNGQVSVQMLADTSDAKKLIEGNLRDLKSGLDAHKLHLESFKIDARDGVQKQMDPGHSDSQRENARQMFGQMAGQMNDRRNSSLFSNQEQAQSQRQSQRQWDVNEQALSEALAARNQWLQASGAARSSGSGRLHLVA